MLTETKRQPMLTLMKTATPRNLTADALAQSMRAYENALRLGHPYLGGEHFLLALAAADRPVGTVLREHGVTPGRVEAETVRLAGAGLFADLDRAALADAGVNIDAVRATAEASFGRATLTRAARTAHRGPGRFDLRPRSGAGRAGAFLPHGPGLTQALLAARRRARVRGATEPAGQADLALGILALREGLVPLILSALGVSGPALANAITERPGMH
jgi:hypothetical protein